MEKNYYLNPSCFLFCSLVAVSLLPLACTKTQPQGQTQEKAVTTPTTVSDPKKTPKKTKDQPQKKPDDNDSDIVVDDSTESVGSDDEYDFSGDDHPQTIGNFSRALGFKNLGNTCYANAALKFFLAHPHSSALLDPLFHRLPGPTELQASLNALNTQYQHHEQSIKGDSTWGPPNDFSQNLLHSFVSYDQTNHTHFFDPVSGASQQQDAEEFLSNLLKSLQFDRFNQKMEMLLESKTVLQLENGCTRFQFSDEPELIHTLSAPVYWYTDQDQKKQIHLTSEAVRRYFSPTPLDPDFKVEGQKMKGTQQQILVSKKAPEAVIIQLKRKVWVGRTLERAGYFEKASHAIKISKKIDLPLYLNPIEAVDDLKKFKPTQVKYRPMAVVVQWGTSSGGHYGAYIYDTDLKSWFLHNDNSVEILKGTQLKNAFEDMAKNSYFLLYGKI